MTPDDQGLDAAARRTWGGRGASGVPVMPVFSLMKARSCFRPSEGSLARGCASTAARHTARAASMQAIRAHTGPQDMAPRFFFTCPPCLIASVRASTAAQHTVAQPVRACMQAIRAHTQAQHTQALRGAIGQGGGGPQQLRSIHIQAQHCFNPGTGYAKPLLPPLSAAVGCKSWRHCHGV